MEINLGAKNFGNIGIARDSGLAEAAKPAAKDQVAAKMTVATPAIDVLQQSEPVSEVPDSELTRDDPLGKLVSAAFNLPPPPMMQFTD
ncbi:MAG: hypothetical protein J6P80_02615 [Kiritimatiellae bacterium]|nr:hypothetical protein [Kiritimatiellia bacterium]